MTSRRTPSSPSGSRWSSPFLWLVLAFACVGLLSRIAPLLNRDGRLLRQFPTEDGYLMLTIARNLALGRGMSTASGEVPTNGTQPLFNFIEAAGFFLVGGDRDLGVAIALVIQVVLSCVCAYGIYLLIRQTLRERPEIARRAALLGASAWFASPIVIPNTMNCLETGLYGTTIVYSLLLWQRTWLSRRSDSTNVAGALRTGCLLGIAFWARIDAVFLIATLTTLHLVTGLWCERESWRHRFVESLIMGGTSVVIAAPWLIHNQMRFGSPMPISGVAQSHEATFASNLAEVPSKLVEYFSVFVPIPQRLEALPGFLALELAIVLSYLGVVAWAWRHMNRDERTSLAAIGGVSLLFASYYGLWFGAPHFVARYLFPISVTGAICTSVMVVSTYDSFPFGAKLRRVLSVTIATTALLLVVGLNVRLYVLGKGHMHFQVVEYVEEHVGQDEWVAAIQTGTLGFFHDRTINLDGKVNPDALRMLLAGKTPEYVIDARFGSDARPIQWLVDWVAIASWVEEEPLASHFELVTKDFERNLGVLRRKSAP